MALLSAFESERVNAPLALAVVVAGSCDPATAAVSTVVAWSDELGAGRPARECLTSAGALGASAGPAGVF